MSKKIIWMQGFDHLPEYAPTSNDTVMTDFIKRLSLIAPFELKANKSTGCVKKINVNGNDYKGLNLGLSANSFSLYHHMNIADHKNKVMYVGCRVSATDSIAERTLLEVKTGNYQGSFTNSDGGAFSFFIEIITNTTSRVTKGFINGQEHFSINLHHYDTYVDTYLSDQYTNSNNGSKVGVGFVYSDFYIAEDDDDDAGFHPYGNLRVCSSTVQHFSGNASAYNTLGLDIVTDLNSIVDEKYQNVGGFLHLTTTPGTVRYKPIPTDARNIIAVQSTGLTQPPAEGCALSQRIYLNGQKQDITTCHFNAGSPSFEQYNSVTNFNSGKSGADLSGLEVMISSAKT